MGLPLVSGTFGGIESTTMAAFEARSAKDIARASRTLTSLYACLAKSDSLIQANALTYNVIVERNTLCHIWQMSPTHIVYEKDVVGSIDTAIPRSSRNAAIFPPPSPCIPRPYPPKKFRTLESVRPVFVELGCEYRLQVVTL